MGRRARQFSLSDADRAELERISRSRTEAKQRVERAKIILGCLDGEAQKLLAQRLVLLSQKILVDSRWAVNR
jgi:hypothetical protein